MILILGNGGRENCIGEKLREQKHTVFTLDSDDFQEILEFSLKHNIKLIFPSKETHLCSGIVDFFSFHNIAIFGPTKAQSTIEGSKYYSKTLMVKLGIPTTPFVYFNNIGSARSFYKKTNFSNHVIKYSGLAGGKGVYLPNTYDEGVAAINTLLSKPNTDGIIIEQKITGKEVSVLAFCNGEKAFLMPQSQDYKRIYDDDKGPNTGGMGAVCPANILSVPELTEVNTHMNTVVSKLNYKGVLYAGIMKTDNGISFLEFNCRFGDPETQVILNLLETDLALIAFSCLNGENLTIGWSNKFAANVVLSHDTYPFSKPANKVKVTGLNSLDPSIKVYRSNVSLDEFTTGGRVVSVVSVDTSISNALHNIYNNISKIKFDGAFYRRDIGCNLIQNNKCIDDVSIGIMASGNGSSIQKILSKKLSAIKIIITNNKNAGIIKTAQFYRIPILYFERRPNEPKIHYYEKIVNILRQFNINLLVLAGYMDIVPKILYEEFFTVNIHPSLLPKFKSLKDMDVHNKVISSKAKFSGCTLHVVTGKVDSGRILKQKQCRVSTRNPLELRTTIQALENDCIYDFVSEFAAHKKKYNVNIKEGNDFVDTLKKTNTNIGGFSADFIHNDTHFACSADGCGTKIDLSCKYDKLATIGIDLVAMNVNDLLVSGAKPLFFMDYIAIDSMDKKKCLDIISGINKGCELSKCALIGGETAEMKKTYLKDKLDLAGFCVGEKVHSFPDKRTIDTTCHLYGIESSGIHSNGYTLVRELIDSDKERSFDIDALMNPTRIYMELLDLYKRYPNDILGVAHITGGGFRDNISRILPEQLTFALDYWEFPKVFRWIQTKSNLTRKEMLDVFNCGYGIVIISKKKLPFNKIGTIIHKYD
jgi:phosphoribosylamine--glycine ligase/phosphoribosylaminoimidazole synthetase